MSVPISDVMTQENVGYMDGMLHFVAPHTTQILIVFFFVVLWGAFFWRLKRRQIYIRKIWTFNTFLLMKRQMLIPLIYTLAGRDSALEKEVLEKLLAIRVHCRQVSAQCDPVRRLELEEEISQALFQYFQNMEDQGRLKSGGKLARIVKDLEFIDERLVELQKVYNYEAHAWNQTVDNPVLKYLFYVMTLRPFKLFTSQK